MAAKVFSAPPEVGPAPELSFAGFNAPGGYEDQFKQWITKLETWVKAHSLCDIAGQRFRYPVGDGYAEYMVYTTTPLQLIHLPYMDGYHLPTVVARGMTAEMVRTQLYFEKVLDQRS